MELVKEEISTHPPPLKNLLQHRKRIPDESRAPKTRLRGGLVDCDYQAISFNHNQLEKVYLAGRRRLGCEDVEREHLFSGDLQGGTDTSSVQREESLQKDGSPCRRL